MRIGHALHSVLAMMSIELHALHVGLPLLRHLIDHILPLGDLLFYRVDDSERLSSHLRPSQSACLPKAERPQSSA